MRIWSLHPKYLDPKGLVALWRETLLAKHVLEGKTKGYKNHPQLNRFKIQPNPLNNLNFYLSRVLEEANERGYNFDKQKINWNFNEEKISVTTGQLNYEKIHLLAKLKQRDLIRYHKLKKIKETKPHPLFTVIEGEVENWEIRTMSKEKYILYHNPRCTKSRETLAILEQHKVPLEIIKYLENIPTEKELENILMKLNLKPQDILRKGEKIYKEQFKNLKLNNHEWIKIMTQNPQLIERPIVIKGNKAIIGRPPENVKELF